MPGDKDVLRALAQEALAAGVHPDRESVLREFVDEGESADSDTETSTTVAGKTTAKGRP